MASSAIHSAPPSWIQAVALSKRSAPCQRCAPSWATNLKSERSIPESGSSRSLPRSRTWICPSSAPPFIEYPVAPSSKRAETSTVGRTESDRPKRSE